MFNLLNIFRPVSFQKGRDLYWGGLLLSGIGAFASCSDAEEIKKENYSFTTFAGWSSVGADNGPGISARFFHPHGLAIDNQDHLYVADTFNNTIRLITPNGTVSTFAGVVAQPGSIDGSLAVARFAQPHGLAIDRNNTLYVADAGSSAFRKIAGGQVATLGTVGSLFNRFGPYHDLPFGDYLAAVAVDAQGNVYGKCSVYAERPLQVFKLTPGGTIQSLAVASPPGVYFGSPANGVPSIAIDFSGKVQSTDPYYTLATYPNHHPEINGYGWLCSTLTPDGTTTAVATGGVRSFVSSDAAGTVFLTDVSSFSEPATLTIKAMAPNGSVNSFASALPIDASRFPVTGVVCNRAGDFFYLGDNAVFKMTRAGEVTLVAGTPISESLAWRDGTGIAARFVRPWAIATDRLGNIYVNDGTLRKISTTGEVTTLIGAPPPGDPKQAGPLDYSALAVDDSGNAYFISYFDSVAAYALGRRASDGTVTLFAVSPIFFNFSRTVVESMAVDHLGNVYLAIAHAVYKVTPQGVISVFAGQPGSGEWGYAEGPGGSARFHSIKGLAVDFSNNVLVADAANGRIRKISPDGTVSTIPGGVYQDIGSNSHFDGRAWPGAVAVDGAGNVFVAGGDNTIRKITPEGVVTLLGGSPETDGNLDGVGSAVRFLTTTAIAVDNRGKLYVTDTANNSIRQGQPAGPPVIAAQPVSQTVVAGTTVQFSVTATGAPAPTYQWYFNGGAFNGATTNTLSFTDVRGSDAGDYTVVVTNELGSVTSAKATLTVSSGVSDPPPASGSGGGLIESWFVSAIFAVWAASCSRRRPTDWTGFS